jgi:hypothetical protein
LLYFTDVGLNISAGNKVLKFYRKGNGPIMMTPGLLAGAGTVNAENALHNLIPSGSSISEVVIYFGALLLVALAFFAWAMVFRRQRRQRRSPHRRSRLAQKNTQSPEDRPRPRTLAEAGGLPPVRNHQSPPPPV